MTTRPLKIIGHRGAKGLAPENTLASFEKALGHHVSEIELDVRVTKDGKAAITHDAHLTDLAGNKLKVATTPLAELQRHKPDLTTLEVAIQTVNRRVPILIEVKPAVPVEPVVRIVSDFLNQGWTNDDFRFGSYDQRVLVALHLALPAIQTVVIENWSSVRARKRAKELGTKRVNMLEYWLWSGFIRAVARSGWELYSFPGRKSFKQKVFRIFGLVGTTNTPRRAQKWARAGLSGVITDFPDRFEK